MRRPSRGLEASDPSPGGGGIGHARRGASRPPRGVGGLGRPRPPLHRGLEASHPHPRPRGGGGRGGTPPAVKASVAHGAQRRGASRPPRPRPRRAARWRLAAAVRWPGRRRKSARQYATWSRLFCRRKKSSAGSATYCRSIKVAPARSRRSATNSAPSARAERTARFRIVLRHLTTRCAG